ncbi:MAG: RluA family pseudouridine synthase [Verrucomicrobiae bacterium]|nr:RluA family pseudouridine synthase [Verrucomicrobiae bacterium]
MSGAELIRAPVLYDHAGILALNKPAGFLSHPNPASPSSGKSRCVVNGRYDEDERAFTGGNEKLYLLHRLDLETSGVLLLCRDAALAAQMRDLFAKRHVRKFYVALLEGAPKEGRQGRWLDHLEKKAGRRRAEVEVVRAGKPNAELRFRVTRAFPSLRLTLLDIELITGLTHQIRVQAASRYCPVMGDSLYGHFPANRRMKKAFGLHRMFLHAARVEFQHPATRQRVIVKAPLPEELELVLNRLR